MSPKDKIVSCLKKRKRMIFLNCDLCNFTGMSFKMEALFDVLF